MRPAELALGGMREPLNIPISQQHVADTLDLSVVHTNKTLRRLVDQGLITWHDRACQVLDVQWLMDAAGRHGLPEAPRPLI